MPAQNLLSTGTTFVSSALADINLSISAILIVGTDPAFEDCISFLKFTLPVLPVASVDSAELRLFVFNKTGESPSPVVVNRVTSAFDTDTVTYSTQPTYVPTASMADVSSDDVLQYFEINVTDLVNQWLSGTYSNEGIALTNLDGVTEVQFGGKTIGNAYEPKLVLTYSAEVPAIADYAYIYNTGNQNIPLEESILFSSNGALLGILHNAGTGPITVEESGTYAVWFIVTSQAANQFALFQNGVEVPGSIYGTGLVSTGNPGMAMLNAEAGDVLTLQNHTSAGAIDLDNAAGGTQTNVSASIMILRIGPPVSPDPALGAVNSAQDITEMRAAIENPLLGLNLTVFNSLPTSQQNEVLTVLLANRPALGYPTVASVQDALDNAINQLVDPNNIYVEAGAIDGNGSIAMPFGTIEEGMVAVEEGGTVHVLGGTYNVATQIIITKPLTLLGESDPLPQIVFDPLINLDGLQIMADNVTIDKLHLISNRTLTADNAVFRVVLKASNPIELYDNFNLRSSIVEGTVRSGYIWAQNMTIEDTTFMHNAFNTQALRLQIVRGTTNILNNRFQGNSTSIGAIVVEPNLVSYTTSGDINVMGNTMMRFTQFVNFFPHLAGPTSLLVDNNDVDHQDRSGSAVILFARVDYALMENILIQNNLIVNPNIERLAVYYDGAGGSFVPDPGQIQVIDNTFDIAMPWGKPTDTVDPNFPVGYSNTSPPGMTLAAFDLHGNINV
ncbi:MAG: hypothetical protein APF84_05740 [Gracilibacter sp. BRH_c7a]|nr:MAG: hypothetical protein APF84_05740 [Gracilibacter sp. BRH_c7a]